MLITIEELERFSGVHREGDEVDISLVLHTSEQQKGLSVIM